MSADFSLEKNGLKRKMNVSVPAKTIEEKVSERLRNLARKVKVDGFRPGKVPFNEVKRRFANSVREEVAQELIQSTLVEALHAHELMPLDKPFVELQPLVAEQDFKYSATFEVFPEVDIVELNQDVVEIIQAEVKESDVKNMLEKLREQQQTWHEVTRAVAKGDKVVIDFEGFLADGKPFVGGSAKNQELVIGSGTMIPGFEDGIIGAEVGKPLEIKVTFPKEYDHDELAGKKASFKINVHQVMAGELPALDEAFAEKFNIKQGGIEALTKDIKENMVRELERRVNLMNREKFFDKLMELNPCELPVSLIEKEIEHLKHEMYHRLFGPEHSEHEKIPDFPRSLFEEQAKRRVHLGLLFSAYVKKHQLVADKDRVDALLEKLASAYDDPDALRAYYRSNKESLAELEGAVMEELVAEKISEGAKIKKKNKNL